MIFDWIENCEKIIKTKHFPNEDGHEKKTQLQQHFVLFNYLENQKNMSKEEIKNFWLETDSVYLQAIPDDDREDWIRIEFNKLWDMRKKSFINFSDGKQQKIYNYPIYQEEIDFLNNLDCDTWIKKAFLLLLVCAKHTKTNKIKYNNTTRAWIENKICPGTRINNKLLKIGQVNVKYKLFEYTSYGKEKYNYIKLHFIKDQGTPVAYVYSPNCVDEIILSLIKDNTLICPQCGKEFIPSAKQQTQLCPKCYKIKRQADKLKYIRRIRGENNL